ncbi:MAG: TraB/GumN family protein [Chloroflexi bacterium]|nr:TraB/GumN family protein [Chloroflexota bacterium]
MEDEKVGLVQAAEDSSSDVQVVGVNGREFIIVGTAHISQQSTDLVREIIERERPDVVCVELDEQRYKTLVDQRRWEALDLRQIIRQKQLMTLLISLLLSSYQKRLGQKLGIAPGTELLEATKTAEEFDIPIELVDRDVRITLRRAWNKMSFMEKMKLFGSGVIGAVEGEEISEEKLAELRQTDVLTELMNELGAFMPVLKTVLIDERDRYIAQKTQDAAGEKVVVVVGAGHMKGIEAALQAGQQPDLTELEQVPPGSNTAKIIGWGIPILIIGMLFYIGLTQGAAAAGENALFWFLANAIPTAVGAMLAFAHPVTIIASFLAAPFTSLTPLIGAGYVAALVQVYMKPPTVKELKSVGEDVSQPKMWWRNKLLRLLLVFIFTTLGSLVGTVLGASQIISNLN